MVGSFLAVDGLVAGGWMAAGGCLVAGVVFPYLINCLLVKLRIIF